MKLTRENVEALKLGDILQHVSRKNSDGSPLCAKVTGKPQIWINRSYSFEIPVKYELYQFFVITREDEEDWIIPED